MPPSDDSIVSSELDLRRTPGGSTDSVNSLEEILSRRRGVELGSLARSTSAIFTTPSGPTPASHQRQGTASQAPQSASTAVTQNTSSSNSPVNSKESMCDNAITLSHETTASAVVNPHNDGGRSLLSCNGPRQKSLGRSTPHRPPSPGSEMVTLEEFLQETNVQSPTIVESNNQENLMCDFFNKAADLPAAGRCTSSKDGARMPTSYVTPTVKGMPLGDMEEGRTPRPGQSVKPSLRVPEATTAPSATPSPHAQTPPGQVGSGGVARSSHPHLSGCRGSSNLSRTFSLASADLLQSSGPGSYRHEGGASWPSGEDCPEDVVLRRPAVAARERPQSARLVGPLQQPTEVGCRPLDPRRLSFAPPKDTYSLEQLRPPSQHQSSSLSLCETGPGRRASPQVRPKPQHRAEVAMVTPVRAVPALKEEEQEEWQQVPQVDSPQLKMHEAGGRHMAGTEEQPKNTPVPPDPNGDPQTVWFSSGCCAEKSIKERISEDP
ncbi:hypothetical protein Z043_117846 [Scleropages formosus]|uniref:Uncharacterized protein n=1 Tax=Scleropages formosus TaxID=113540 RepID=A0A0N8JXI8_SCLFO|nr:hypothetical protein Z043_117846 [Scleropages formosus]